MASSNRRNPSDLTAAIQRVVEGEEEGASEESPSEPVHIDIPKIPEVNPEVYRDVEAMLFKGFLTVPCEINGVRFVFKSLNHHEFEMVQWLNGGGQTNSDMSNFYDTFIAYGVFMVGGQNILTERGRWIPELITTFSNMSLPARMKVVRYLSEVNRKASNAVTLTEAYALEVMSRYRWAQLRGLELMHTSCTGVPGTDSLGLNFSQLVWRALNYYEDQRDQSEREWENAKFIGSCFAGKEIQKVYNQDKERRRKEQESRIERRDKIIRKVMLGESEGTSSDGRVVKIVAQTVEELAQQLERDLRGEKDWHDQVVAAEEERIRNSIKEKQAQLQELASKHKEEAQGREKSAFSDIGAGLTAEEVQFRIQRRRQLEAQSSASRVVYPELEDPRMADFYARHLALDEDDTYQSPKVAPRSTELDPTTAMPTTPTKPRATPFRRQ